MAVTTTYIMTPSETYLDLIQGPGQGEVDIVSLANGGLAVTSTSGGFTDLDIFTSNGKNNGGSLNIQGTMSAVDQLDNGDIVIGTQKADGELDYAIRKSDGSVVDDYFFNLHASDPDVTALSNGNLVYASVANGKLDVAIPQNRGVFSVFHPSSGATDERPSIAGLDGGGYAVAWSATRGNQTEVWYAVYENSGGTRLAPALLASTGATYHKVSVSAASGGGFAIAYEDKAPVGATTDIKLVTFSAAGTVAVRVDLSNPDGADIDYNELNPYVTKMSSGLLAVSYTRDYVGMTRTDARGIAPPTPPIGYEDDDTVVRLYDPARAVVSAATFIDVGKDPRLQVRDSAVAELGAGHLAVFHTNVTNGDAEGEVLDIVRKSVGDGADDTITGDHLIDDMRGGGGGDTYIVQDAADRVYEADVAGVDIVKSSVTYSLSGPMAGQYIENLTLTGTAAINATGNGLANTVTGNDNANVIDGKTGADAMIGNRGNDTFIVDNVGDKIVEFANEGTDTVDVTVSFTLASSNWVELLQTTSASGTAAINLTGNNIGQGIVGNNGVNKISGLGGDDLLFGLGGNDTLAGGAGKDTFQFNTALNSASNVDTITDFNVVDDTMKLAKSIFAALNLGNLSSDAFWKSTAGVAHDASDRIIYDTDSGALYYDADGALAGGVGAIKFAVVGLNLGLTNADFTVGA